MFPFNWGPFTERLKHLFLFTYVGCETFLLMQQDLISGSAGVWRTSGVPGADSPSRWVTTFTSYVFKLFPYLFSAHIFTWKKKVLTRLAHSRYNTVKQKPTFQTFWGLEPRKCWEMYLLSDESQMSRSSLELMSFSHFSSKWSAKAFYPLSELWVSIRERGECCFLPRNNVLINSHFLIPTTY